MGNRDPLVAHDAALMIRVFPHDSHFVAEDLMDQAIAGLALLGVGERDPDFQTIATSRRAVIWAQAYAYTDCKGTAKEEPAA
jgi:hypothetical protein